MSNVITNLRVRFGADTKEFRKGTTDGKKALNDFTNQGKQSLKQFSGIFGSEFSMIASTLTGFSRSLVGVAGGMKTAAAGTGVLTGAMRILKMALISTGIGALVVALGSLVAYFTGTKRGADQLSVGLAGLKAIFNVLKDIASGLGETIVQAFENPKETVKSLWEFIKSQFVNRIAAIPKIVQSAWNIVKGIFSGGAKEAANEFGDALAQFYTGMDKDQRQNLKNSIMGVVDEMGREAKAAMEIKKRLNELRDAELALKVVNSDRARQVSNLRYIYQDETNSLEERRNAMKKVLELEELMLQEELNIQREKLKLMNQEADMAENLHKDYEALAEQQILLNDLEARSLDGRRRLIKQFNDIDQAYRQYMTTMEQYEARLRAGVKPIEGRATPSIVPKMDLAPMRSAFQEMRTIAASASVDIQSSLDMGFSSFIEDFSTFMGELSMGYQTVGGLGKMAIGGLADMLISMGKLAVGAGIAAKGIKEALMLKPGLAIAAGAALIALGSAVKASLKNVSTGGGSAGSFSGSNVYDTRGVGTAAGMKNFETQVIRLEVSPFKIQGPDLVAAVNKELRRRNAST